MEPGADHDPPDDALELFAAGRAGDDESLGHLLVRFLPDLRAFVRLQLGAELREREAVSDVVQSVCLELLRNPARFDFRGEPEFRGWLFQAVANELRDKRRYWNAKKRRPRSDLLDDEALLAAYHSLTPSQVAIAREDLQRIEHAFERLSEQHARILLLHRFAGLDISALAEIFERSPEATRKLLHRAQVALARELDAA